MRTPSRFRCVISAFALSCLVGCSSGGGTGGGGGGTPPATPYIYASEGLQTDNLIYSYPLPSSGTSVVATTTALPSGYVFVEGLKSNGTNVFVLSRGSAHSFAVSVYTASKGTLTLVRSFQGDLVGGLGFAVGFAADASGRVYIGHEDGTIAIYSATADGLVQPTSSFNVGTTFINNLAFDAAGNLFVMITGGRGILYEYAAGLASTLPIRTVPITAFSEVNDMLVDGSGNVYITGQTLGDPTKFAGAIVEYGPESSTPLANNASVALVDPSAIALTPSGSLYAQGWVSASSTYCTYLGFSPSATGDASPSSSFTAAIGCGNNSGRMTIQ